MSAAKQPRVRVPALAWHLERHFGRKVAQCPECGSHDVYENYAQAAWRCGDCRHLISDHVVRFVPADVNVRQPWEEDKPRGMWLERLHNEARKSV